MSKASNNEKLIALKQKREAKARKRKKIVITALAGFVAIVAVTIVLLSVLKPKVAIALEPGGELPVSIQIISNGGYDWGHGRDRETVEISKSVPDVRESDYIKFVDSYKSATTFSYSYGILDNQWFPKMKLSKNGDDELIEVAKADIDRFAASTDNPLVVVRYDTLQSVTIDKVDIEYNFVFFKIAASANQIIGFKIYLVNGEKYQSSELAVVQSYRTYEINAYGNTSKIFDAITEIKENT